MRALVLVVSGILIASAVLWVWSVHYNWGAIWKPIIAAVLFIAGIGWAMRTAIAK